MGESKLTIRGFRARAVNVKMARPLQTSGGALTTAPLVLFDLLTEEGITGNSYVFCYTPAALVPVVKLLTNLESSFLGDSVVPFNLEQKLQKSFRLLGPQGLTMIAQAALDMAAWDALAKLAGLPLVRLLGGEIGQVPAYNSCGLGIIGPERAAKEALELLEGGFQAIKVRLGYPAIKQDLEVVRAVRRAVGDNVQLMVDYNQALSVPEALRRVAALDQEELVWIEEPTSATDYAGHARISQEARTPIQIGENWWGTADMAKSIAASASDYVMPDLMKIGGVSGWLRAAALAQAAGLPMSSHLFPEISAHLLAVTPTAHLLEYVDWATPVLQEPFAVKAGFVEIPDRPGGGLEWNETAVQKFLVE
jgi:mandelate racemase